MDTIACVHTHTYNSVDTVMLCNGGGFSTRALALHNCERVRALNACRSTL